MDEGPRRLLRRLALGLPIGAAGIAIASAPPLLACSCPPAVEEVPRTVSATWSEGGEAALSEASTVLTCEAICERAIGRAPRSCSLTSQRDASCEYVDLVHRQCISGRAPLREPLRRASIARSPITKWLLESATAEVASVPASRELAGALRRHGAPASLAMRASRAASDEVRHARLMVTLAARRDGRAWVRVTARSAPHASLEALASHNASVGCVLEAHAALVAASQAECAEDADVRWAMTSIARDEAQHALLSLDVHAWAQARLDASARARVEARRRSAASTLAKTDFEDAPESLGLPRGERARELAAMVA